MTNKEKALWLQEHYGNYSLKWYLADSHRLEAIFDKEYSRYLSQLKSTMKLEHDKEVNTAIERLRAAYLDVYHSDYDSDNAVSRLETNARAQAIRHLWMTDIVLA